MTREQRGRLLELLAEAGWWYVKPGGEDAHLSDGLIAGPDPAAVLALAEKAGCPPMPLVQYCTEKTHRDA